MFDPFSIALATLFALFWLMALASHIILLKLLLTPYERVKLRLPAGSWPLLLTLTIADLVALLTALPFTSIFAIFNYWFFGEVLCDMSSYVKVASLTVSSYVILGLLMQSYEMVVKTPRPPMSTVKLGLLIGSIYLLAVVTALPMLFTHKVYPVDEHNHRLRESLETFELYEDRHFPITQKTAMETLATNTTRKICAVNYDQDFLFYPRTQYFFLQFAVPLAIVFFLFIKITDTMNKQGKSAKNKNVIEEASRQQLPQDWKFVRTILILTVVFYLSWAPVNFFIIFLGLNNAFRPYAVVLSELTFFIKPLLLFAVNTNFRNALRTIGVPTIEVEDANSYQVGFSKVDEEGGVY